MHIQPIARPAHLSIACGIASSAQRRERYTLLGGPFLRRRSAVSSVVKPHRGRNAGRRDWRSGGRRRRPRRAVSAQGAHPGRAGVKDAGEERGKFCVPPDHFVVVLSGDLDVPVAVVEYEVTLVGHGLE